MGLTLATTARPRVQEILGASRLGASQAAVFPIDYRQAMFSRGHRHRRTALPAFGDMALGFGWSARMGATPTKDFSL